MNEPKPIEPISFPQPEIHDKKWGQEDGVGEIWITNNDKYCLKILKFGAGKSFSNHYHILKEETWYVESGQLHMEYYDLATANPIARTLFPGMVVHIPAGNPHKLTAIKDSVIYEASSKHYEFDSYRIGKGSSQG